MHRPKFGSVLAAAAVAMAAVVPMFASPAGAANSCAGGEFPSTFAAQSGLKVACHTDPGTNTNHIEIHDADNAVWHHGAAHNVTLVASPDAITAASSTIKFAAGTIQTRDIRRPINAFNAAKASMFAGGTFIVSVAPAACTTTCTSAVVSQKAKVTGGTSAVPITATVENTNNRYLDDVTCAAAGNTLTSVTAKWAATDANKSVSGGPLTAGTFIVSVAGNVATLNQTHAGACAPATGHTGDQISVGGVTYAAGVPQAFNGDPMAIQLSNTAGGGQGFTCSGSTLGMVAGSKADTGGFVTADIGLTVVVKGATTVTSKITAVNTAVNTSATISPACPSGITAAAGTASVSTKSAGAPANSAAMATLGAELNLNPVLVATQDDCNLNTFEGFEVVGGWQNPGVNYATNTSTPPASVAQILFPTSVLAFDGFIVPKRGGDSVDANPHYNYSFPLLPTSLAVCLTTGSPSNDVVIDLGINAQTLAGAPFLGTGSGNVGDPPTRQLLPETGTFNQTAQLITNPSTVVSSDAMPCTIAAGTATPGTPCGDG